MHRNITGNVVRGDAIINPEDPMTKTQLFKHISEWGQYTYGAPMHTGNLEPNSFQIYLPPGASRWQKETKMHLICGDAIINPEDPMTKTQLFKHIS